LNTTNNGTSSKYLYNADRVCATQSEEDPEKKSTCSKAIFLRLRLTYHWFGIISNPQSSTRGSWVNVYEHSAGNPTVAVILGW
jgi:hypothetical protein